MISGLGRRISQARPSRGRGARALRLSCLLGAIEVLAWACLGWIKSALSGTPFAAKIMVSYVADHFGDITIGLATTAYVVFTYHLLESTEAQHRRSAEPYLTLRWYRSDQSAGHPLKLIDKLADEAYRWLINTIDKGIGPDPPPHSDRRFVSLIFPTPGKSRLPGFS